MYLCTLYFLIKAMYKYIRVCSRRKSATSSKGVRFPIFLVLKLHVSMRTNKKHDPPCYILHLQWIGILFEVVLWTSICKKVLMLLKPVCCKKKQQKVPDQLLISGIGDLWRTWMIPKWLFTSPSDSFDYPGSILHHSESSGVPYSTNQ